MINLEPVFVANLAADVYAVKDKFTRKVFHAKYKKHFDFGDDSSLGSEGLDGKSGAIIHSEHMMGVATKGTGIYSGHAFVALKGTASGYDALTDLNAGVRRFHTGGMVHQGFYYTFESFFSQLKSFISSISDAGIHTIHCVGHSLGGALATLVADWVKSNTSSTVKLYTFGSPRVGMSFFSDGVRKRLGEGNVFRVYHKADPVPMVPTWPFIHVPDGGNGDLLVETTTSIAPHAYHFMVNYINSTKPGGVEASWEVLRGRRPATMMESSIEAWLKSDGFVSMTLNSARLLGTAILWVVKKVASLAGIALIVAGGTAFTVLDRLAILMHKAMEFSKDLSFWVLRLIKRMAQLMGIVIVEGASVTVALIRSLFVRVHHSVSELVLKAGRGAS